MRKYLQKTTNNSYTHEDVVIQHYQNGSYDCGLFVCQNAKQTVLDLATDRIKQDNMAVIRKMMFIELMKNIVLEWEVWYLSFGIGSKNARPFQPLKKRRSNYIEFTMMTVRISSHRAFELSLFATKMNFMRIFLEI